MKTKIVKKEPKLKEEPKIEAVVEPEKIVPPDEARLEPPAPPVLEAPKADPDYLRQYQFKNVNNQPTVGGVETDPDAGGKAQIMKRSLLSQPRVSIFVPKAESEDPKVKLSVNLNGYRLDFPKNVYLEVPQQIAEVIRESLNQQASALLPFQIRSGSREDNALS